MHNRSLREVFDEISLRNIVSRLTKTKKYEPSEEAILFDPIEYGVGDKTYIVEGEWVKVDDIIKYASSSCRKCNSRGYFVTEIMKHRLPNPQDYIILAKEPIGVMSEEQKKLWVEKEKKNPLWRVMMPCQCALKGMMKRNNDVVQIGDGRLMIRIRFKEKGNV